MGTLAFCPTALDESMTEFKLIPNHFPVGKVKGTEHCTGATFNKVYVSEEPEHATTK